MWQGAHQNCDHPSSPDERRSERAAAHNPSCMRCSQRGAVLNQTVIPLQQGTGTNPTIGVSQVRPALVLPQGTVQMAIPLQQSTGTNQRIGFGPANAGASMRHR
jgi:hypothetical protein